MTFAAAELHERVEHGVRVWRDPTVGGRPILGLGGPPVSSLLLRHLARPLAEGGYALALPELFDPPPRRGRVIDLVERLAPLLPGGDGTLIAHGNAWPVALGLAERGLVSRLVLLDGPIAGLDPFSRAFAGLARVSRPIAARLLRPALALPVLASSAALRRLVVNPYLMDRDIVAMLGAPWSATAAHRAAVADYLADIYAFRADVDLPNTDVLWVWAGNDILQPKPTNPEESVRARSSTAVALPGARHLAPEEVPWLVADAILERFGRSTSEGRPDTDVAVFDPDPPEAGAPAKAEKGKKPTKRKKDKAGTMPA